VSTLTIPNVFVTGTTINAAPFNANFSAIQTWSANIDNTNIGAAGLFASQILPTTSGQATFGGTQQYTFPYGVGGTGVFTAGATTTVPMTINGITSQFADLFDIYLTSGGSKDFWITSSGNMHIASGITFNAPLTSPSNTAVALANDNAAPGGLILNVPTGSTNGFQFQTAGSTVASITAAGLAQFTGAVQAGSATAGTATAGDVWASRSTTTGVLNLGGSASVGIIDYGVTTANVITFNAPGGISLLAAVVATNPTLGTAATLGTTSSGGAGIGSAYVGASSGKGIGFFSGTTYIASFDTFGGFLPGNGTSGAGTSKVFSGTGAPTINAPNASIYLRYDGTPGTNIFYINTSGASTTGTSWTAKF